jgi:hypothetical protein
MIGSGAIRRYGVATAAAMAGGSICHPPPSAL